MSRASSFGGVILAAGESSRMGSDKALLPWPPASFPLLNSAAAATGGSGTLLSAAIQALEPYCDLVIVVAGENEAETNRAVARTI